MSGAASLPPVAPGAPPALLDGGPCPAPEELNVAAWLARRATDQPDALAVAVAGRRGFATLSAAELARRSDRTARALAAAGVERGTRVVLMVTPGPDFFATTFALFQLGAVPVFVDPGMGLSNLGACLAAARPSVFLGIPRAVLARRVLGWAADTLETVISTGPVGLPGVLGLPRLLAAAGDAPLPAIEPAADELAAILFTSGSTGVPKGVEYSHGVFAHQVLLLRELFGIEPGEVDLSTFPLFALFGPALGMASVVPRMDTSRPGRADPRRLVEALRRFGCTSLFASPALIDKLGRHGAAEGLVLDGLRRAISAGAPAHSDSLRRFCGLLPDGVQVFTPYGATESMPVTTIGSDELLGRTLADTDRGAGVCVGRPAPGMTVQVIEVDDGPLPAWRDARPLPAGSIGEIVVAGPVVTRRYWEWEQQTALAKSVDADGTVRHRMGDLGWIDGEGRLWMCGRKSQRVETPAGRLCTVPCEAVFNVHPDVRRSALVGVERGGRVQPVVCVEPEPGTPRRRRAALPGELAALAREHGHTAGLDTFLVHRSFPVDVRHNAKIFRERLAVWAAGRLG